MAFHWRLAMWNAVLIGLAVAVFGFRSQTLIFAILSLAFLFWTSLRIRSRFTAPLLELSSAVRRASNRGISVPAIVRGTGEARELSTAVSEWSRGVQARMKQLSDSRIRLESILRAMVEGVLVFDVDGRITMANDAVVGFLDHSGNAMGKTCLEVFRNEAFDLAMRRVLRGTATDAVEFQTASGRVVRALLSPVAGEDGQSEAVVAVLHDLTDIRHVDRIRRDFVANVSHEFKTPLTSIRGYAETMREETESAPHREFADVIYRNARYLEALVNDLLALARIESEPPSTLDTVDLQSVLNEQVAIRRRLPEAEAMSIEVECPSMVELRADRARLSAAIANLIDNAIRYNRSDGKVRVRARVEGPHMVISVSDTGFGIREEELPRIFERFYRVDKARTRNSGGIGLGLAIARHAVESQGGVLTVESKIGAGSTFTIRLPASR